MNYPVASLIALALIAVGAALCLFAAHLPGLRRLTGAAPLDQAAVPSVTKDMASGHLETVDQFAARTNLKPTRASKGGA